MAERGIRSRCRRVISGSGTFRISNCGFKHSRERRRPDEPEVGAGPPETGVSQSSGVEMHNSQVGLYGDLGGLSRYSGKMEGMA